MNTFSQSDSFSNISRKSSTTNTLSNIFSIDIFIKFGVPSSLYLLANRVNKTKSNIVDRLDCSSHVQTTKMGLSYSIELMDVIIKTILDILSLLWLSGKNTLNFPLSNFLLLSHACRTQSLHYPSP